MNFWDILEIEPTTDTVVIKKAYAEKLKLHHPEDDPEGFQRVRQAYESALNYAKYMKRNTGLKTDELVIEQSNRNFQIQHHVVNFEQVVSENANNVTIELIEQFMNKVEVIYNSSRLRKDINQWKVLLENEAYWNLDLKKQLSYRMLNFLQEHYQDPKNKLPTKAWRMLNEHFFWFEQKKKKNSHFSVNFVDYIVNEICTEPLTLQRRIINFIKKHSHFIKNTFWSIVTIAIIIAFFTMGNKIYVGLLYGMILVLSTIWK